MEKLLNEFSLGLFLFQTLLFILLVFFLKKYAWKPILNAINDREQGIKDALDAAEKARLEMQNLKADNERILKEARTQRENMLKEAREIKAKIIAEAKEEAQTQANSMIQQAQNAIENEKKSALNDLKKQVANLSVEIAEKVVGNELTQKDKQLELVDALLDDTKLN